MTLLPLLDGENMMHLGCGGARASASMQSHVDPDCHRPARQVSTSAASSRRASSDLELDGSHLRPIRVTLSPAGAAVDRHAQPAAALLSQHLASINTHRIWQKPMSSGRSKNRSTTPPSALMGAASPPGRSAVHILWHTNTSCRLCFLRLAWIPPRFALSASSWSLHQCSQR